MQPRDGNMMVYIVCLGFDTADNVKWSIDKLYEQTDLSLHKFELVLVNARFPIPESNDKDFRALYHDLKIKYYLELPENKGQTRNINAVHQHLFQVFGIDISSTIIFWDRDHKMTSRTWLNDMMTLRSHNYDFITCGSVHYINGKDINIYEMQEHEETLGGITFKRATWPGGYPIACFSGRFASRPIAHQCDFYGATEADVTDHCRLHNLKTAVIKNWSDEIDRSRFHPLFQQWKSETIGQPHGQDFKDWLLLKNAL